MGTTQRQPTEYKADILPWRADCDVDPSCKFQELFRTEYAAQSAESTHAHDYRGQVHHNGMSILESMWNELDRIIEEIRDPAIENDERFKGRANGVAWGISVMSNPHYPTETEVLKQAMLRWKMAHGLADWEPTVGYKFWAPPPGQPMPSNDPRQEPVTYKAATLRETRKATQAPARRTAPTSPGLVEVARKMSKAEQDMMRQAYTQQNFSIEDCSKMFKLSEADVKKVLGITD